MYITDFKPEHIESALAVAADCYRAEKSHVPALPDADVPESDLGRLAYNRLGAAAFDGDRLVGYLCCCRPFDNSFNNGVRGTWSPVHASGVLHSDGTDRADILRRLYQYAADKWADAGIVSHAITLYAHDSELLGAMFRYGFGLRCVDAVRLLNEHDEPSDFGGFTLRELDASEVILVRGLRRQLSRHLGSSPCFMYSTDDEFESWLARAEKRGSRLFAAINKDEAAAFIEVTDGGENFATESADMLNICGAYCVPEHRGKGLMQALVRFTGGKLRSEGIKRLGVDYESINPNAAGFWVKQFTPYTNSVVRRIDESILRR